MARGTLRIYVGAAPGVGKTFAMLNEGHRRLPGENRFEIHLFEVRAPVFKPSARYDLERADLSRSRGTAVGLDESDDDIGPAIAPTPALIQHRERLTDAGSSAQVDP